MSVRDEKFHRMNRIMASLETSSRSFDELLTIAFGSKLPQAATRTLQFDLSGLKILSRVIQKGDLYYSTESKTKFDNLAEYKIVMRHSRRIILGFDSMNPERLVLRLVREATKSDEAIQLAWAIRYDRDLTEKWDEYFLSHLKTNYYQKIYQPLLRYIEIGKKYPKIQQILERRKTVWQDWDEDEVTEIDPEDDVFEGPFGIPKALAYGELGEPIAGIELRIIRPEDKVPVFKQVLDNPDIVKEYISLQYDLASKIYGLIGQVKNGIPLEGSCDACPLRHVKIEE